MAAECQGVAADVDERVHDARGPKELGGAVERIALGVTAEIELHGAIHARHYIAPNRQVAHAWMSLDQAPDVLRIRHGPAGFVAVKTPETHEPAYRGIEEIPGLRGEALRLEDERGDFRRRADIPFAARNRPVEGDQVALLPRVQFTMHPVELAKNPSHGGVCPRRVGVDDGDLDDRPEDIRAFAVFGRRGRYG